MRNDSGITLVELMVTLTIAALFVITFGGMYLTAVKLNAAANNTAEASNYGYKILRKYVNSSSPASNWFDDNNGLPRACDDITNPGQMNDGAPKPSGSLNDGRNNTSSTQAPGTIIESGNVAGLNLPQPATYAVNAVAPYGCAGSDWGRPVKVQVDVTYGPDSRKVSHSAYASF